MTTLALHEAEAAISYGTTNLATDGCEKIDKLEKLFKCFRAEVDMKFKIMQQILTTRDGELNDLLIKNVWKQMKIILMSGLKMTNYSTYFTLIVYNRASSCPKKVTGTRTHSVQEFTWALEKYFRTRCQRSFHRFFFQS